MSRTKGALNKRTRAALSEAAEGKLSKMADNALAYLLRTATDTAKEPSLRMQAATAALPYLKPRLASIEQTNIEAQPAEADIHANIKRLTDANPGLLAMLNGLAAQKATSPPVAVPEQKTGT